MSKKTKSGRSSLAVTEDQFSRDVREVKTLLSEIYPEASQEPNILDVWHAVRALRSVNEFFRIIGAA